MKKTQAGKWKKTRAKAFFVSFSGARFLNARWRKIFF
jgi:hypothetical protein